MLSPDLTLELRSSRPLASPQLRERVLAVAERAAPPPRRFVLPSLRRAVLVAAPAVLALAVGGAVVHGLVSPAPSPRPEAVHGSANRLKAGSSGSSARTPARLRNVTTQKAFSPDVVPSTPSRLQQYGATLRVQVDDREALSEATKRAMRVARLLGGYVGFVQYSAPRHARGAATLVVRVPVDRVQDAVAEYSDLGTILSQKVRVLDVTKAVQEQAREISRLESAIERLEAGGVTAAEAPRLQALQARLDYLTKRKAATVRRADLARISLTLLTKPRAAAAPAGRMHRTLSDAGSVLVREGELLLYALIVAGPLLLLGAAAIAAARLNQRRRDAQLLQRT
jgi:hypothetical protein